MLFSPFGLNRIAVPRLVFPSSYLDDDSQYAARDGVTSAFELEIGTPDVDAWYRMLGPSRLINFGVGAGQIGARMQVLGDKSFLLPAGPGRGPATPAEVAEIARRTSARPNTRAASGT